MTTNASLTDSPAFYSLNDSNFDDLTEDTNDFTSYWQSIPDPPTPTPNDVVDVENEAIIKGTETRQTVSAATILLPSPARNLSSPTLNANWQSSVLNDVSNLHVQLSGLEGKPSASAATLKKTKTLENDNDLTVTRETRGKRRRSLFLPSDVLETSGRSDQLQTNTYFSKYCTHDENANIHKLPHCSENGMGANVVKLVRAFCSLSMDRRKFSDEAKEIEMLSGYPIIREANAEQTRNVMIANVIANGKKKFGKSEVSPSNESIVSCKREFLLKVQPVVKSMESQKQQDLEDVQLATNCQVQRSLNGVGYCYFDTNNGVKVTADDYKLRYSAMINARRSERRKNRNISPTKSIKEKIANDHSNESNTGENRYCKSKCTGNCRECGSDNESIVDAENSTTFDESVIMEDDSSSLEFDHSSKDGVLCFETATKLATNEGLNRVLAHLQIPQYKEESDSHSLLHGMPPSTDPRVISARRQLFRKIDEVLEEYSREILAIQNADCRERKLSIV